MCSALPIPPQRSGVHLGPIPDDLHSDLLKRTPVSPVQTMTQTNPIIHHLASNAQASTSGNYVAGLTRMKEDLAKLLKTQLGQLGLSTSRNNLYQRPYPDSFDLVPYPASWCVPDFIKFSCDDNRST